MSDKHLQYLTIVLLHLTIAVVPLYFRFNTEELFEFNKMLIVYAVAIILSGLWITRSIIAGSILWKRTPFDMAVVFFLVSQLLSTLFSMHPRTSLLGYYTRFHGGLLSYIAYSAIYFVTAQSIQKKHIKPLLTTLLVSASVVSVYGISEHFGHSPSCFIITNGQTFDASCWIQDVQSRVFATFGQPNWLAAYIVLLLPIAVWFGVRTKATTKESVFSIGVSTLLFLTLIFTKSRSGFLAFIASAVCAACFVILPRAVAMIAPKRTTKIQVAAPIQFLAVLIGMFITVSLIFGTPFTSAVFTATTKSTANQPAAEAPVAVVNRLDEGGTDSGEIRKIVWSGAIAVWKRYPILGSGVETFAYSYYQDRPTTHNVVSEWDFLYNKAHNELLNFLATTGLVGTIAYVFLVSILFIHTTSRILKSSYGIDELLLLIASASGVIALTISNFFGFSTVAVTLIWFLYLSFASIIDKEHVQHKTKGEKIVTKSTVLSGAHWFSICMVWILTLIFCVLVYRAYAADKAYALGKGLFSAGDFIGGSRQLHTAIGLAPKEALYYDELAHQFAKQAVESAAQNNASTAAQLVQTAIQVSDTTLTLNPAHLNFYKTRARVFITLAQLQPEYLLNAKEALVVAIERSPTDAKLVYNLALVELGLGNTKESTLKLRSAVQLKPNYGAARLELAKQENAEGNYVEATKQLEYILQFINPSDPQSLQLLTEIATKSAAEQSKNK